jgi:Domain of unknown function (DUF1844)
MSNPNQPDTTTVSAKEITSAMFASMVMQQTNMASIFLGLIPHPETGKVAQDLDHARYFIDQLEMIEVKTRGNLDKMEEGLLKQSLTNLRLAFVEAVSKPTPAVAEEKAVTDSPTPTPAESTPETPTADDDSRKKFTKKY